MVGGGSNSKKKLKSAARKLLHTCGSFSFGQTHLDPPHVLPSPTVTTQLPIEVLTSGSTNNSPKPSKEIEMPDLTTSSSKAISTGFQEQAAKEIREAQAMVAAAAKLVASKRYWQRIFYLF
ncbi:hypothetical protein L6452_36449 [Arctium lappa]|uniref:Uncharacterized protein n=1 Tax=Arctium lappa TaxID=4217 RepID=A0ACB8Y9P9_ARCLA|nr:hypothetical protein L6452_36449 [Arctium lappa]